MALTLVLTRQTKAPALSFITILYPTATKIPKALIQVITFRPNLAPEPINHSLKHSPQGVELENQTLEIVVGAEV